MREIKFELVGRNVKFNEIVREVVTLQQLIDGNFNRSTLPSFFDTNNSNCEFITKRQFTGLTDRHGKEIYEGDIVKGIKGYGAGFSRKPGYEAIFEVSGWLDGWGWRYNLVERSKHRQGYRAYPNFKGVEVIGNIYENPELLTKEMK